MSIIAGAGGIGLLVALSVVVLIAMACGDPADCDKPHSAPGERPSGRLLFWRALHRRCPICGWGRMFGSYFDMNATCPICGAMFWRNEGEYLGPMVIGYTVAVTVAMASLITLVLLGASEVVQLLIATLVTTALTLAVMPWSRSFWTVFLYINGEMVPRAPKARKRAARQTAGLTPWRRPTASGRNIGVLRPRQGPRP